MKKEYERAELEIVLVSTDIITASGGSHLPPLLIENDEDI